jgi:hypothetical protein
MSHNTNLSFDDTKDSINDLKNLSENTIILDNLTSIKNSIPENVKFAFFLTYF